MRQKTPILILFFSGVIDNIGIALVYPIFAYMFFDRERPILSAETSDTMRGLWLGVLLALQPLATFFSSPVLGAISDSKGRKKILLHSLIIGFIGYLIALGGIFLNSLFLIALYRLLVGVSSGNNSVVSAIVADISRPEEKIRNYGLLSVSFGAGFVVGPFLGGLSMEYFGKEGNSFSAPFVLAGVLVVLNYLLVAWKLPETHAGTHSIGAKWFQGLIHLRYAMSWSELRGIFASLLMFTIGWSFFTEFIPLYLIDRYAFSPKEIGYYFGYTGIFYALGAGVFIRPVLRLMEPSRMLLASQFLSGINVLLFLLIRDPLYLWICVPTSQCLMAFVYPTASALVSNRTNPDMQGEAMGVYQAIIAAALAICPLLFGTLVGPYPALSIIVGGGIMLLAGFIFQTFDKVRKVP